MKKNILRAMALVIGASFMFLTAACGNSAGNTGATKAGNAQQSNAAEEQKQSSDKKGDTKILRLAHHLAENHCNNLQAIKFAELVEKKTNGKIKIEIYTNGQLGGQKELLQALKIGTVDMSISDTGLLANYDMSAGILDLPYMFNDIKHVQNVLSGKAADIIKEKVLKSSGIRTLTIQGVAFRNTILAKKSIKTIDDFKGVKIRTPESPVLIDTFKYFNANPTAIASGEAYTAIQTGVVDGMEGNAEFLNSIKIYEVAKNWFETSHNMTCTALNISDKVYSGLPEDMKKAITEAANESLKYFYEVSVKTDEDNRKAMANKGVIFNKLDIAPFKNAVKPMIDKFIKENNAQEIYDLIVKAGGQ